MVKGKILGGAPRTGKWTRQPEDARFGGKHRGSIIALLVLGVLIVGGIGGFLLWNNLQLEAGLLRQEREAWQRPDWVRLDELPPYVGDAFAVVVDTASFARRNARRGEGLDPSASRQLVRQVHLLDGGLADEARELAMAPLLELRTSSRRRLELYLNRVSLGRTENWSVFGVEHAARDYFGKEARALTLSEAATLAGILLPPRLSDPESQPGAVGTRRNEVLRRLLDARRVDEAAFRAALAEPLGFQPGLEHMPMSRPVDWQEEPEVIRLPEEQRPRAEPAEAGAG